MSRSRLFYVLVPILLVLHSAYSCTRCTELVLSEQRRFLTYQQRGLPREFTKPFYKTFLRDLIDFSEKKYNETLPSEICFTDSEVSDFSQNVYNKSSIDEWLKFVIARFPHLAYLKRSEEEGVPIDDRFETASSKYFQKTMAFLDERNVSKAATLPRTVKVFYDPAHEKILFTYLAHASYGPKMKASNLLYYATGMVLSLEFMKVPRTYSIQPLRHAVAWLSTVFRALQKDGGDVKVPVQFIPFYKEAFKKLQKKARLGIRGLKFTKKVVEEELGDVLKVYTRLDTWGRLQVIRWEDISIQSIEEELFNPVVLKRIAEKVGYDDFNAADHPAYYGEDDEDDDEDDDGDDDIEDSDIWKAGFNSIVNSTRLSNIDEEFADMFNIRELLAEEGELEKEKSGVKTRDMGKVIREADLCETPLYEHLPLQVSTWEEACCAAICGNSMLMLEVNLSREVCCSDCNQLECATSKSSLEVLAMVHLEPYGDDLGGAIPVSL